MGGREGGKEVLDSVSPLLKLLLIPSPSLLQNVLYIEFSYRQDTKKKFDSAGSVQKVTPHPPAL